MSSSAEARKAAILRGIRDAYPDLCEEAREQMARQLVRLIDASVEKGYDLRNALLRPQGARKTPLGTRLKEFRERAGRTQQQVATHFEWHSAKVTRIETGAVPVTVSDVRILLDFYGVRDRATREAIIDLARTDRQERRHRPAA